jgi:ADP-ribose pyrophosphatase
MTESESLFNGRWLTLRRRGSWEFVERTNPRGAVIIVAETDAGAVLFVEQYRVPIQQMTIEMPAGLVGDVAGSEDEDILVSAQRELEEETGYRAARIEPIMGGPSSAGMSTEIMTFVRAFGLARVGPGGGDQTETIIVHEVPRAECAAFLVQKMAQGYAVDPKLYAGLYFLERDAEGRPWSG